ncbi:uncharacterized protein DNG_01812 [Cephalotrichum gorgonifer]|uniref:Mediator of RNA polymerase II transcription subunit 11 n=1 Tax=Cephalotrichum gorgonifer TaxID=2041049 RepID=A0AAE8SS06_9PEZI|nr:uncharacterized protein DNG_01812 [Cephalotrichum gorgonifer]
MSDPNAMEVEPTFIPFTIPERIQQLNEIDKKIAQIMLHTSKAMTALTPASALPQSASASTATTVDANRQTFKESMDAFVTTLHHVDVHMKRQIFGLQEAGIIDLSNDTPGTAQQEGGDGKGSVRPTAVGTVGGLEMGWLNSRGNRVERGMEGELWGRGRAFLEEVAGSGGEGAPAVGKDGEADAGQPMER